MTLIGKGRPSPELLSEVRAAKPELLALLSLAKEERPTPGSEWAVLAQQPGHCGSCQHWTAAPEWGPHLGECELGRKLHGWLDGHPHAPVIIQAAHACPVVFGTGNRWNPREVSR